MAWDAGIFVGGCDHCDDLDGDSVLCDHDTCRTAFHEAADVDGCGTVRQFFQITLPYIKPTLITTVLLRTIWIFNSLDLVVIITDGGPANSSQTLPAYMYSKAFGSYDFGFAAALGVMLMIILGLYALIFLKVTKYDKAGDF